MHFPIIFKVIDLYINMMKEFQSLINSLVDEVYIINGKPYNLKFYWISMAAGFQFVLISGCFGFLQPTS